MSKWQIDHETGKRTNAHEWKGNRDAGFCHFCHAYELLYRLVKGSAKTRMCSRCLPKRRETGEVETFEEGQKRRKNK